MSRESSRTITPPEPAIDPAGRQPDAARQLFSHLTFPGPDQRGERGVFGLTPFPLGEELLQQPLHLSQLFKGDSRHQGGERGDGLGREATVDHEPSRSIPIVGDHPTSVTDNGRTPNDLAG